MLSKLKEAREQANYSQYKIAKILKIPRTTYASYEIGKNRLPFNLIVELKKILNTTDDSIFLSDTYSVDHADLIDRSQNPPQVNIGSRA